MAAQSAAINRPREKNGGVPLGIRSVGVIACYRPSRDVGIGAYWREFESTVQRFGGFGVCVFDGDPRYHWCGLALPLAVVFV